MKVPHIDREVSFGNRHSKISGPKDFLQKNCKSSHPNGEGARFQEVGNISRVRDSDGERGCFHDDDADFNVEM